MSSPRYADREPDQPEIRLADCSGASDESEAEFIRLLTGAQCSLRAYILALLGGHKKDADDILQDTNVAIWEKRRQYDNDRPFLSWALAFAFNRIRAFRRDTARARLVFSSKLVEELHSHFEQSFAQPHAVQDYLRLCVEKLTPAEQELIHKRYHGTTSVEALSSKLNKSAGSVANRLFRIRERLRSCIQSHIAQSGHKG